MVESSEASPPEACAEFRLTECEATFKVKNFVAAVAATDTVYPGHPDFREIASCPIMSAGDFKFAIVIVWGVDERGRPDLNKKIGVCGRRVDHTLEICTLSMAWKLLNQTDSNSCRGVDRGRLPWGESASTSVSLAEAFDVSKGWLHDGALHIRMKLTVVTNITAVNSSVSDDAVSQQDVCNDMRTLLDNAIFTDVSIEVGDEQIMAHRNILAARSPVFNAMLHTSMSEGREKKNRDQGSRRESRARHDRLPVHRQRQGRDLGRRRHVLGAAAGGPLLQSRRPRGQLRRSDQQASGGDHGLRPAGVRGLAGLRELEDQVSKLHLSAHGRGAEHRGLPKTLPPALLAHGHHRDVVAASEAQAGRPSRVRLTGWRARRRALP